MGSAGRATGLLLGVAADGITGDKRTASRAGGRVAALVAGVLAERLSSRGTRRGLLGFAGTALATWGALGGAALAARGSTLARQLESEDLDAARETVADLDGRHTEELHKIGLTRASVETVAENTAARVVGPLVWGAVLGTPGMLAYTAVKAGAATVGERRWRHRWPGFLAARADEFVDLVPTRCTALLTVAAAPVVGGSADGAWLAWRRDAAAHPSPNAGRVEAAFAGALEIRLGGRAVYPGGVQQLPVLGAGRNPDAGHVTRAVELSRLVGWLAGVSSAVLALLFGRTRGHR